MSLTILMSAWLHPKLDFPLSLSLFNLDVSTEQFDALLSYPPFTVLVCYLNVSLLERRDRKSAALDFLPPTSCSWPLPPSSPFFRVSSNSMVMSTRPVSSAPPPAAILSVFLSSTRRCPCWWGRARASAWRTGWSRGPASSPPQPLPESYFLSLRDSCFFFSEAAAFTLEGSAAGGGPCGGRGRGTTVGKGSGREENRGGESLQEERSVRK